jgi:membrane protease YdiL (CAAX protease family)
MLTTGFIASYLLIALAGLPLIYNGFRNARQNLPLIERRDRIASPFGLIDVSVIFFIWLGGQIISTFGAVYLLDIQPESIENASPAAQAGLTFAIAASQVISTLVGLAFLWLRYGRWDIFGIQPAYVVDDVVIGVKAFLMVVPGVLLIQWALAQWVSYEHSTLEKLSKDNSFLTIASTWFAAVLVAPVLEEIFFRGILQAWLQRAVYSVHTVLERLIGGGWDEPSDDPKESGKSVDVASSSLSASAAIAKKAQRSANPVPYQRSTHPAIFRSWMPIFASAGVFALAHIGQGLAPVPLFVFGIALGYLYRQTGSIVSCIVLHFGLNAFSMFWFTMQILFPESGGMDGVPPVDVQSQ